MSNVFADKLIKWGEEVDRNMPWKKTKDPYKIWLSEIILQQTRVEQGLPYYLSFIEAFPTINDLAQAHEDAVLKLWQGLGYYSRARNLHYSAKYIVNELKGIFPKTYIEIIKLKGVGDYTASAISSFAFGECRPVLDGNVSRVISRVWGIEDPIDIGPTNKKIKSILVDIIDCGQPAKFNQAIMDFGATFCTPKNPSCDHCQYNNNCLAFLNDRTQNIPFKSKKIVRRKRFFNYLKITTPENKILIRKRIEKDIWQGLYEFPLIEKMTAKEVTKDEITEKLGQDLSLEINTLEQKSCIKLKKHLLTHQEIYVTFYEFNASITPLKTVKNHLLISKNELINFAFPKILTKML